MLVVPNGTKLEESNALTILTLLKKKLKSEPGTTKGSHQVVQSRQPTDLLALRCKEACIHVDTWNYAMPDTAIQLPWQRLPPSDNGAANSAEEEQTGLLHATQGASVQVQRQTWLFCCLHCTKDEEKISAPTNRELRQQSMNSYNVWILT
jgi:hypothetical protein